MAAATIVLALAGTSLARAAESHVEASCDTGPIGSDSSASGDATLSGLSASAKSLRLRAATSVTSLDGLHRYCDGLSRFSTAVTVEPGTSGLSVGDPVTLSVTVALNGALGADARTSDRDFFGGGLVNASLDMTVPERIVCASEEGRDVCKPAELADFTASGRLSITGTVPTTGYAGVARDWYEWSWQLRSNRGQALGDQGAWQRQECSWPGELPCLAGDPTLPEPADYRGTHTILVDARVGDRIELFGALSVLAQARHAAGWVAFYRTGDETLALRVSLAPGQGFEGIELRNEVAPPETSPALSAGDVTITEGSGGVTPFSFPVRLSAPSDSEVTVAYTTEPGTAVSGEDFMVTDGTVTFEPGETQHEVVVMVNADTVLEPGETIQLVLGPATGASVTDAVAEGTIVNDDRPADREPPTLSVPSQVTANATGPVGAVVTYAVQVTDDVSTGLVADCAPASGTGFLIGTTTVRCSATDAAGHTGNAEFEVAVVGAPGQIVALIDKTLLYLDQPVLAPALKTTLRNVIDAAVTGRTSAACSGLRSYAVAVRAAGTRFAIEERSDLLADVSRISAVLACR